MEEESAREKERARRNRWQERGGKKKRAREIDLTLRPASPLPAYSSGLAAEEEVNIRGKSLSKWNQ